MTFTIKTKGFNDIIDITSQISKIVKESKLEDGVCVVFLPHSTCAVTTMEYEDGLSEDLKNVLEKIAPMITDYEHCKKWGDCNGYAHVLSALLKTSLSVPIEKRNLALGTWQQIVLIDFDNRARERIINVKIIKEI